MLCSHRHRFIYLKTVKTAGTSVEVFFEPCCRPPDAPAPIHLTAPYVGADGIVGLRGLRSPDAPFYNHMPAAEVRERLGDEVWNTYLKFCCVRNPFEKVVSAFWMALAPQERVRLADAGFGVVRDEFNRRVEAGDPLPLDRHVYCLDGRPAVDLFIRHERLAEGVAEVCRRLDLPTLQAPLGHYKAGWRMRPEPAGAYYGEQAAARVSAAFAWELDYFGYAQPAP